jgi:hypothetical protein
MKASCDSQSDWIKHFSKKDQEYYWANASTGESSWSDPTGAQSPARSAHTLHKPDDGITFINHNPLRSSDSGGDIELKEKSKNDGAKSKNAEGPIESNGEEEELKENKEIEPPRLLRYTGYTLTYLCAALIFAASYLSYIKLDTDLIVLQNQRHQCSMSEQAFSFAKKAQLNYYIAGGIDTGTSNLGNQQYWLFANFTACSLSDTKPFNFIPAQSQCQGYGDYSEFKVSQKKTISTSLVADPMGPRAGDIYTNDYMYCGEGYIPNPIWEAEADPCFTITCTLNNQEVEGFDRSYNQPSTVDCANAVTGDDLYLTSILRVSDDSVYASCSASICGTTLTYFQTSSTIQPLGVYTCTIPADMFTTLSLAFANALTAIQFVGMLTKSSILMYTLGLQDVVGYLKDTLGLY